MSFPEESLEELRCFQCKNYLSYFPIYLHLECGSSCGRCPIPEDQKCARNVAFENMAKNMKFPCRNKIDGCLEELLPSDIKKHEEKQCKYALLPCPDKNCDININLFELKKHYEKFHSGDLILNDKFDINVESDFNRTYLLVSNSNTFLVHLLLLKKTLFCTTYYMGSQHAEQFICDLTFSNRNLSKPIRISTNLNQYGDNPDCLVSTNISNINQKSFSVEVKTVKVFLKCIYCLNFINKKMLNCKVGHILCEFCHNIHKGFCKNELSDFVLDEGETIQCRNRDNGCPVLAQKAQMEKHESQCIFDDNIFIAHAVKNCVVCNSRFQNYKNIISHYKISHEDRFLDLDIDSKICWNFELVQSGFYMTKFTEYAFALVYRKTSEGFSWFVLVSCQKNVSTQFYFEISIIHDNDRNQQMIIRQRVNEPNEYKFGIKIVDLSQFIIRGQIKYKFSLIKV